MNIYGQTYIGASIGIDNAKIEENSTTSYFEILDNGYKVSSTSYGIRFEQGLTERISFGLISSYTKKEASAFEMNFIAIEAIKFHYFRNTLFLKYRFLKSFSIGGGGAFSIIPEISSAAIDITYMKSIKEFAGIASIGYKYRDFLLELRYYKGFYLKNKSAYTEYIKPINSIELSLSYMLKVFEKREGKKVHCPEF